MVRRDSLAIKKETSNSGVAYYISNQRVFANQPTEAGALVQTVQKHGGR